MVFLAAIAAGALSGGTVHGFFPDGGSTGARILWPAALLAIGVAALAAWQIAARLWCSPPGARRVSRAAVVGFAAYALGVLLGAESFLVAIVGYVPALVFLLAAFLARYRRTHEDALLAGAAGLGLALVASALQQAGVALPSAGLDRNALYHVLQGVAVLLLYVAARACSSAEPQRG